MTDNVLILGSVAILGIVAITIAGVSTGHDGVLVNSAFGVILTIINLTVLQIVHKQRRSRPKKRY